MDKENKEEQKTNKKVEQDFYFPDYEQTISASSLEEAEKKLNKK